MLTADFALQVYAGPRKDTSVARSTIDLRRSSAAVRRAVRAEDDVAHDERRALGLAREQPAANDPFTSSSWLTGGARSGPSDGEPSAGPLGWDAALPWAIEAFLTSRDGRATELHARFLQHYALTAGAVPLRLSAFSLTEQHPATDWASQKAPHSARATLVPGGGWPSVRDRWIGLRRRSGS